MGISGLEPETMMGCAMKIMEQIINLWKTIICKCIAHSSAHYSLPNFSECTSTHHILPNASAPQVTHMLGPGIQVTMDIFKFFISVLALNLPFGQKKSTLGQGPGTVSSSFICD